LIPDAAAPYSATVTPSRAGEPAMYDNGDGADDAGHEEAHGADRFVLGGGEPAAGAVTLVLNKLS